MVMENIGDILRQKKWEAAEVEQEMLREASITRSAADFGFDIGPGLVAYIQDIRRRQDIDEVSYDIPSLLWRLSGISPDTKQVFAKFKLNKQCPSLKKALDATQEWARYKGKPFITLAGPPGVGKTFLAVAATQDIIARGGLVMYRRVKDLLDELRKDSIERHRSDVLTDLRLVPFLIIDDLGVQKSSEWSLESLDDIVDFRYSMKRQLMVCTNAKSEDLPPRIADRLADIHIGEVIQIAAPSYRRG